MSSGCLQVLFATGYLYNFPFLQGSSIVTVEDNRCAAVPRTQSGLPAMHCTCLSYVWMPLLSKTMHVRSVRLFRLLHWLLTVRCSLYQRV